ncbi:MAG TPA: O-antigen ligase family protein [Stenomitos sp.]
MRPLSIPLLSRNFLYAVLILAALVDLPRRFNIGPLTGLATLTMLCVLLPILLGAADFRLLRTLPIEVTPLVVFLVWGFLSMSWNAPTIAGAQSLLVPAVFILLVSLAYHHTKHHAGFTERLLKLLAFASRLAVVLYALSVLVGGLESNILFSARSFALSSLLFLAWHLANWRYGVRTGLYWAFFTTATVGLSLSRTALATGLLFYPLARMSLKNRWGLLGVLLIGGLLAFGLYQAIYFFEPLRARFLEGDTSMSIGGIAINATGRMTIWQAILTSFLESPLIGKGIGASEGVVAMAAPGLGLPHCDYLRLLHDLGLIGLGAWILGQGSLLVATCRAWIRADRQGTRLAPLHLTAFLGQLGVAFGMVTDNPLVYIFLMAPLGIIVGASLGARTLDRPQPSQREALPCAS